MSYFCANAISIDKKNLQCKVKGGDNNLVPRSNYYSEYFPIVNLLREVSGGMIQFTSRTDKNIAIENIVYDYSKKIQKLTNISTYDAYDLPIDSERKLREYKNVPNLANHWNSETINKQIIILQDESMLNEIEKLKEQFVQEVINLKIDRNTKFVIFNKEYFAYVVHVSVMGLHLNHEKQFAKKFSKLKAIDTIRNYDKSKYEIREFA